jgi:hypothetical protein
VFFVVVDIARAAASAEFERREQRGIRLAQRELGLYHALGLDAQVWRGGQRLGDQAVEGRGAEALPPSVVNGSGRRARTSGFGPLRRQVEVGAGDRLGERAAGGEGDEQQAGEQAGVRLKAHGQAYSEARATTGSRRAALRAGR